jgi:hypothetical protein
MASYVPSSQKRYSQFRGPTNSSDYNELTLESYTDIVRLYNLLKDLVQQLEQDLEDVDPPLATPESLVLYARFFNDANLQNETVGEETIPLSQRLSVDTTHGLITLPETGSESNLVSQDDLGATLVPPSFAYTTLASDPAGCTVSNGTFYYCLSENGNMAWERLGLLSSAPSLNTEFDLWIRVPIEITSNVNANCLVLHLFPIYFIDLIDVSYSIDDAPTNNLTSITYTNWGEQWDPGVYPQAVRWIPPLETDTNSHINNCRLLRFDFDPQPITAIHLKFRQRNWMKENDLYVVPIGASFISLENHRYAEYGSKVIKFSAPESELIYRVTDLDFLMYNQPYEDYGDLAGYRLFYLDGGTGLSQEVAVNEYIAGGTDEIFLEVTLYETSGKGTPALSGVKMFYENS